MKTVFYQLLSMNLTVILYVNLQRTVNRNECSNKALPPILEFQSHYCHIVYIPLLYSASK